MYEHETFLHAPITEATVTLRIAHLQPPDLDALNRYATAVANVFPTRTERSGFSTSVDIANSQPLFRNVAQKFIELRSADDKYVVQVRADSFAFSRLQPYVSWESFLAHTLQSWKAYIETLSPTQILDVRLRYVNKVNLPNPFRAEEYFLTRITHHESLPDVFTNVFFSLSLQGPNGATGNVGYFLDAARSTPTEISNVLQIDVYKSVAIDSGAEKELAQALEDLRDFKNQIFFLSITEKTKDLFR